MFRCKIGLHPWEWSEQRIYSVDGSTLVLTKCRCKDEDCRQHYWRTVNLEKINRPW
jgi:hypothetical protein